MLTKVNILRALSSDVVQRSSPSALTDMPLILPVGVRVELGRVSHFLYPETMTQAHDFNTIASRIGVQTENPLPHTVHVPITYV